MWKTIVSRCVCLFILIAPVAPTSAGGNFEGFDITGAVPSPVPGQIVARPVPQKWDPRCLPVPYSLNTTLDPVPNPLGPAFLALADAAPALQQALDVWNGIPTSFIDMRLTGTVENPGFAGFDMVNELTFRADLSEEVIALSFPISLIEDVELVDGDDIDGDGDSDVSNQISTCADVDGDGDIEFPAGFYKAGTILDSDVEFNTVNNRFTIDPADADTEVDSMDLVAIAVHEFGHSHGLSHTLINQLSAGDGTSATMFPFFDTTDPADELGFRTLAMDDIAFSSFLYPEGSASEGPAALGPGDIAFDQVFGVITGELRHGRLDQPLAGGSVFAVDRTTGALVSSAFSGTTQLSFDPATGDLFFVDDPSFSILNGTYVLPVPAGRFAVGAEAVDDFPVSPPRINFTTQVGAFFGQQDFNEEFFYENILVSPGEVRAGLDIVTRRTINIRNFGALTNVGFTAAPPGRFLAVRLPADELIAAVQGQDLIIRAAEFFTAPFSIVGDMSVVPVFAEALLTAGVVNSDGTASVDLENPLQRVTGFIGQGDDFAPFFFPDPHQLGELVRREIESGRIQNLFLVLQVPTTTPFPGVSALPPLIGLSDVAPLFGLSYLSDDGGITFTPRLDLDFMFGLVLGESPLPMVVNALVTFERLEDTFETTTDPTGCPAGFVGKFSFEARLTNISSQALTDLEVEVTTLTGGNLLQNAEGAPAGVGAHLIVPQEDGFADDLLSPGEMVDVPFVICLQAIEPFELLVDVLGVASAPEGAHLPLQVAVREGQSKQPSPIWLLGPRPAMILPAAK